MTNSRYFNSTSWVSGTYSAIENAKNTLNATSMAAYMKGHFSFLGVPKPTRSEIQRRHWADRPRKSAAIAAIHELWNTPFREAQYLALDLLKAESKYWPPEEALPALEAWITTHSWWDSVDALAVHGVGVLLRRHPEAVWPVVQAWIYSDNLWLKPHGDDCAARISRRDAHRMARRGPVLHTPRPRNFFTAKQSAGPCATSAGPTHDGFGSGLTPTRN